MVRLATSIAIAALLLGCTAGQERSNVSASPPLSQSPSFVPRTTAPGTGSPVTRKPGSCSSAGLDATAVLQRLFSLSDKGDPGAVADCFSDAWLQRNMDAETLARWSRAGPASDLSIKKIDEVNGVERFSVTVTLAHSDQILWRSRDTRLFSVAREDGVRRISEMATALAAP